VLDQIVPAFASTIAGEGPAEVEPSADAAG
jgi:hypothetical protein